MTVPPYAISGGVAAEYIGEIAGSRPDWHSRTFQDAGRRHVHVHVEPEQSALAKGGLQALYSQQAQPERRLARHVESPVSCAYAEPVVVGAKGAYYSRRALPDDSPAAFRPSRRLITPVQHEDRAMGKRLIPEPLGAPPRPQGVLPMPQELRFKESPTSPEPAMPRLMRPFGATILRESDTELSYERAFGRKIRVGLQSYRGSGRAGDLSHSFAPPKRPEDDSTFFKTLKETPTFIRFMASLPPKPTVSAHQRREEELRRNHEAELAAERKLVASLTLDVEDGLE